MLSGLALSCCSVDLQTCMVERDGARLPLTELEAGLLRHLVETAPRIVPRSELLAQVWGNRAAQATSSRDHGIMGHS